LGSRIGLPAADDQTYDETDDEYAAARGGMSFFDFGC
jgi:hypothetical protein